MSGNLSLKEYLRKEIFSALFHAKIDFDDKISHFKMLLTLKIANDRTI